MTLRSYAVHIVPNSGVTAIVSIEAKDAHQAQFNVMAEHPEARVTAVLPARSIH